MVTGNPVAVPLLKSCMVPVGTTAVLCVPSTAVIDIAPAAAGVVGKPVSVTEVGAVVIVIGTLEDLLEV